MNATSPPKQKLRVSAKHIGPIMDLDAELSDGKQHLIFARNGTGKSFIARALRLLDPSLEQGEAEDEIPSILVSEEAVNGQGTFGLYEGEACVGSIGLNAKSGTVNRSEPHYIYHVFSEDFIEAHVRNRLHGLDGNISHEIIIGKENSEIDGKSSQLEVKQTAAAAKKVTLSETFETEKASLKSDFGITGSLGAFKRLNVEDYFSEQGYNPPKVSTSLEELRRQYDLYKSFPSDPDLPVEVQVDDIFPNVGQISEALVKQTSPSSVAESFKDRIRQDTLFFSSGVHLAQGKTHCPFCTQSLGSEAIQAIDAYTSFFEDEEAKHTRQLEELNNQLERLTSVIKSRQTANLRAVAQFDKLKKFFPSTSEEAAFDLSKPLEQLLDFVADLQEAIATKKSSGLSIEMKIPLAHNPKLSTDINAAAEANRKLFDRVSNLSKDSNAERLKIQNDICAAFFANFFEDNSIVIVEIKSLIREAENIKKKISTLQKTHGSSAKAKQRVVETFQLMLRYFFSDTYTFDEETFSVRRKKKEIARGPDRTLSDGEKSVIAFCYYLARIHLRVGTLPDYKKVFLIIDDPVSSLSFDYIYRVSQALKYLRISGDGGIQMSLEPQLTRPRMILLSHNNYFYNVISTNNVVKGRGLFQLIAAVDKHQMTNQKAFATPHMLQLRDVLEVSKGAKKPDHTTPNSIRSVVEGMWKFCRPDIPNFEDFVKFLISDHEIEIRSVLLNDLCHGGKFSDLPHREEEIIAASKEALKVVETFASGQLESC